MRVLIVFGSKYGNTRRLAEVIGDAMRPSNEVRVVDERVSEDEYGEGVDLLVVGAPTQIRGLLLPGRHFLNGLERHAFGGVAAAAFDTRLSGPSTRTGAASQGIARRLTAGGCRLVVPPQSFLVAAHEGPLADGEEARAIDWAHTVLAAAAPMTV